MNKIILIVDDSEFVRNYHSYILEQASFDVLATFSRQMSGQVHGGDNQRPGQSSPTGIRAELDRRRVPQPSHAPQP